MDVQKQKMQRNSFGSDKSSGVNIKVIVRCRPFNEKEKNDVNNEQVVKINNNEIIIKVNKNNKNNETQERKYHFDYVCDEYVDQKTLFNDYIFQIVDEVLEGFNCTLFCYGQTGTGKTYTMEGKIWDAIKNIDNKKVDLSDSMNSDTSYNYDISDNEDTGIMFRAIKRIFDFLNKRKEKSDEVTLGEGNGIKKEVNGIYGSQGYNEMLNHVNGIDNTDTTVFYDYNIKVSYLEIYNEELCDLLSSTTEGNRLRIYEDMANKNKGLSVDKLEEKSINSFEDIYYMICSAVKRRRKADTLYNKQSSRSHSIFTISLTMTYLNNEGETLTKIGKLNLVDLAGSENAMKSCIGNFKVRQQESCNINQSLLTLGRVINALVENSSYIPYRDSKLTRLLQDSLGGKTKTFIVATISPSSLCIDETLGTLDYVYRAKNIKNKPEINAKTTKQVKIRDLNNEIQKLKNALTLSREKKGVYLDNEEYNNIQNSLKQNQKIITEKNKILMQKTKEINHLLGVMDHTNDAKKQVLHLAKNIIGKYKAIQTVHDYMINKMTEEKCVSSFLMEEFQKMEETYYHIIKLYKEYPKKLTEVFNGIFQNRTKNIEDKKTTLDKSCEHIMQVLIETKNDINMNKKSLGKSIKCFQKLISQLCFKKKDLLNFVLDHLDIVQKFDQNHEFIIEKIKKNILQCKLSTFSKEQMLHSLTESEETQVETSQEVRNKRKQLSEKVSYFLKEIAGNTEGVEDLNEINTYLTQEKTNSQSLIRGIQIICKLFQTYLHTFTTSFKKKVEEKNNILRKESQHFYAILENLNNDYNSFEERMHKKNSEFINIFKMEIREEINLFQEQLLDEIKSVVAKNVHTMNEKINLKFDTFNSNLQNETKEQYKHFYTSSLKTMETFLKEYQAKTKSYQTHFLEAHDKFYEAIEKYYFILNCIITDLQNTIRQEQVQTNKNVNSIVHIFNETVEKNNTTIENVAEQFHQHIDNNVKEKEHLFEIISNRILQEKNAVSTEEEKAITQTDAFSESVKTCTDTMLKNVDKFDLHLNEIISFIKRSLLENMENENVLRNLQTNDITEQTENEQREKIKNIKHSIEKFRTDVNLHLTMNDGSINSAHLVKERKDDTFDQDMCERKTSVQTSATGNDTSEQSIPEVEVYIKTPIGNETVAGTAEVATSEQVQQYVEIKKNILQELEEITNEKNVQYRKMFDDLYENLNTAEMLNEPADVIQLLKMLKRINDVHSSGNTISNTNVENGEGSNSTCSSSSSSATYNQTGTVQYTSTILRNTNDTVRCDNNNNTGTAIKTNDRNAQKTAKVSRYNTCTVTNIQEDSSSFENGKLNKNELNKTEVESVNKNIRYVKNKGNTANNENKWNKNHGNINGNMSPSNKMSVLEIQSEKTSPIMKRLNNDVSKDKKFKIPRRSAN